MPVDWVYLISDLDFQPIQASIRPELPILSTISVFANVEPREQPTQEAKMSAGAKQRLMSEYKGLEKEKWVNIEVHGALSHCISLGNTLAVHADLPSIAE